MKTLRRGKAIVLHMETEDFADPPPVEAAFTEVVKLLQLRNVVVDMKSVTRLNSIGLSTIAAGADVARAHRARFALAGLRPEVERLLKQTGIADDFGAGGDLHLEIVDDVEAALDKIEPDDGQKQES